MQSDNNQPRQDDKSSQVEHTNGLYMHVMIALIIKLAIHIKYEKVQIKLVFLSPVT